MAAAPWATYSSGLGYLGANQFRHNLWLPLLIAAGAALVIAIIGETARRAMEHGDTSNAPETRRIALAASMSVLEGSSVMAATAEVPGRYLDGVRG